MDTRVLQKEEIDEYVNFFKAYYPIQNLDFCVIIVNENDWKTLYEWYDEGAKLQMKLIKDGPESFRSTSVNIFERHGDGNSTWNDVVGMYAYGNTVLNCIQLSKDRDSFEWLRKLLEDKEWFIMLRADYVKDRRDLLDTLFHEILHVIEVKLQIPIYRGSSMAQGTRDQNEIVRPYVLKFMSRRV